MMDDNRGSRDVSGCANHIQLDTHVLTIDKIHEYLPADSAHLLIGECQKGIQPSSKFLVGSVYQSFNKPKDRHIKRLEIKEILNDGSMSKLKTEVKIYGTLVDKVNEAVTAGKDLNVWIILKNARIDKFRGYNVGDFTTVSVEAGGEAAPEAQVWVVEPRPSPSSPMAAQAPAQPQLPTDCKITDIVTLLKQKKNAKVNVCGVIKRISEAKITKVKNFHMYFVLEDASCVSPHPKKAVEKTWDIMTHLFFKDQITAEEKVIKDAKIGDVLLIRNLTIIDYYTRDEEGKVVKELSGKFHSPKLMVLFPESDKKDDFITLDCTFVPSDELWERVRNEKKRQEQNVLVNKASATIADIREGSQFVLHCKVFDIEIIYAGLNCTLIIGVADGTTSKLVLCKPLSSDADQQMAIQKIPVHSPVVYIHCQLLDDKSLGVKKGDIVSVGKVHCRKVCSPQITSAAPVFGLFMQGMALAGEPCMEGKIRTLPQDSEAFKAVETRLESLSSEDGVTSAPVIENDSLDQHMQEMPVSEGSGSSHSSSGLSGSSDSSSFTSSSRFCSQDKDNMQSGECPEDMKTDPQLETPQSGQVQIEVIATESVHATIDQLLSNDREDQDQQIYRVCGTVKKLLDWKLMQCTVCQAETVCCHTLVWGACLKCKKARSVQNLKEYYPESWFRKKTVLPCPSKETEQPQDEDEGQILPLCEGVLIPLLRVGLILSDPQSGTELPCRLNGQKAEVFFDEEPTFRWAVGEDCENISSKIEKFLTLFGSHEYGIMCLVHESGEREFIISDTKLKVL